MAAGQGFKTFATGDVLTAADTNGYLMQGVWVFASAAARTSAVTSPQEGNMSFLKDTNSTEYYDGAAWVPVAGTGASGPTFSAHRNATTQTLVALTATKMSMNTELWDSDSCYDTANYRFTPNKAGYYDVNVTQMWQSTPARTLYYVYKNGTANLVVNDATVTGSDGGGGGSMLINMNGSTDYIEFFVLSTGTPLTSTTAAASRFSAVWIRSL